MLPNYHKWNEFKLLLFLIFQLLSVLFVEKFKINLSIYLPFKQLFIRICAQTLVNLLNLLTELKAAKSSKEIKNLIDLIWNIIKTSLFLE